MATRDGVDIRYYSIIYNVVDDIKAALKGMLAPTLREKFLGYAEIREVFNITKVGKVAGCMVTEGMVKRGAKVRLLRDNVVIHEGSLKTLKRFKDEVREVKEGFECGMAFENYDNIEKGDMIECFEVEQVAGGLEPPAPLPPRQRRSDRAGRPETMRKRQGGFRPLSAAVARRRGVAPCAGRASSRAANLRDPDAGGRPGDRDRGARQPRSAQRHRLRHAARRRRQRRPWSRR